jgi:hypothetical protein
MARQRRIVGDVVRIDLGDGTHTYARVLAEASFAFYDARSRVDLSAEEVVGKPVLFIVAVMNHAVTRGRWPRVGHVALEEKLATPPPTFIQGAIDGRQFRIYEKGTMRPATREECEGLERCAAWDPTHVEDRLLDHYAGRPNVWFESLKIR